MAFGGVEIGRNNAVEALKPITKGNIAGYSNARIKLIGIKMVAVAVLLMMFDRMAVR